jgi:hypothetical protein
VNNPPAEPAYHPNTKEDSGLYCFLNPVRPCTAECMAYDTPPQTADYQDKQFAHCMLLVNAHRAGKHLVVLAQVVDQFYRRVTTDAADKQRAGQTPPAPPR